MRYWPSIQLYSGNFDGSWTKSISPVSTSDSAAVLAKTLWIINDKGSNPSPFSRMFLINLYVNIFKPCEDPSLKSKFLKKNIHTDKQIIEKKRFFNCLRDLHRWTCSSIMVLNIFAYEMLNNIAYNSRLL